MKKILFSLILAGLLLSLSMAAPAFAGNMLDGKVVIGENFTLKSGETIDGDLVVISGSALVEPGSRVTGSVVVMGGSADLAGQVDQNVTIMGGNVTLRASAVVNQQLAVLGGSILREEGAQVKGGESQGFGVNGNSGATPEAPAGRPTPLSRLEPLFEFVQSVLQALVMIVVLSVLALLIAALWPESTTRVSAAIATAPAVSGLLGLLTLLAIPILLVLLAITICLAPVSLLGAMVYMAALLFGWVALGLLLGNRLAAAFRKNWPPAGAALLGTFIVTAIAAPLWFISPLQCLGVPLDILFACLGLGAVVLTRFGSTPYVAGPRPAGVPPLPPAPVAPASPVTPPAPATPMAPPVWPVTPVTPTPPEPPAPPVTPAAPDITLFGREPEPAAAPELTAPPEPTVPPEPPAGEPPAEPPAAGN